MTSVAERVKAGDVRTVARLIRDIDDGMPGVKKTLKELYPYTGKAHVIGITGSPGVGKSTLVDQMINHLRKKGKTVGTLAIDPTSPFSGGAILGDRVRMQRHALDQGVYIRSMATRGHFGGLTHSTRSAIDVLDAMGKDYIIVETVGVGQDEVDVVKTAHTTIIVLVPGMGDDIQAIKAGILEIGDIFVINKSDREGTDKTLSDIRAMIEMDPDKYADGKWKPPIIKTQAIFDKGVSEFLKEIDKHWEYLKESCGGKVLRKTREKVNDELAELIKNRFIKDILNNLIESKEFGKAVDSILDGTIDPYTACDNVILPILGSWKKQIR